MFIENFYDTFERPSTVETLKTIKQKHDESLRDYVKHFCNARNASCTSRLCSTNTSPGTRIRVGYVSDTDTYPIRCGYVSKEYPKK
jgi:hypothetical protein